MLSPSGDQEKKDSDSGVCVKRRCCEPSASMTYISLWPPSRAEEKARRSPSEDQAGKPSRRGESVSLLTPEPSTLIKYMSASDDAQLVQLNLVACVKAI